MALPAEPATVDPCEDHTTDRISNDMVRGAPLFTEVAESFMQFMGDGIFAAHNVNFDFGFVVREYERLERRFRFPKLCTCAGMRRRFPGHKSYGLGKLCESYGIELVDHHRALCDAKAGRGIVEPHEPKARGDDPSGVGRRGVTHFERLAELTG
jgi:DNA polymerase-3 subunit epsilon